MYKWIQYLLCIALIVWVVYGAYKDLANAPDQWMVVTAVEIPDHYAGQDPHVVYDRTVLQPFRADWYVKIYPIDATDSACVGGGTSDYRPDNDLSAITLEWYVGKPCDLYPGKYVARTVWNIGDIVIKNTSNVFEVMQQANDFYFTN